MIMAFKANMLTKDGKKMMYLIYIGVKENCENYTAIWSELKRRMATVSTPIIPVDWTLYDDEGNSYDKDPHMFYAQTFETGMGFITGILKIHEIRANLDFCKFYNGDAFKNDPKEYEYEDTIETKREYLAEYHPDEKW